MPCACTRSAQLRARAGSDGRARVESRCVAWSLDLGAGMYDQASHGVARRRVSSAEGQAECRRGTSYHQHTRTHAPGVAPRPRRLPVDPCSLARPGGPSCRTPARFPGLRKAAGLRLQHPLSACAATLREERVSVARAATTEAAVGAGDEHHVPPLATLCCASPLRVQQRRGGAPEL